MKFIPGHLLDLLHGRVSLPASEPAHRPLGLRHPPHPHQPQRGLNQEVGEDYEEERRQAADGQKSGHRERGREGRVQQEHEPVQVQELEKKISKTIV